MLQGPSFSLMPTRLSPYTRQLPTISHFPTIHPSATIRNSQVTGDVTIGAQTHVVNAIIRADEGTPFYIGNHSNLQDFVTLHALSTQIMGQQRPENLIYVPGKGAFAIYIGDNTSLAHGVLAHGPVSIGDNTFIGFKSTIDQAHIGNNVEIGAHAYIRGVQIPDGVAIAPGAIITNPFDLQRYIVPRQGLNERIAAVNAEMALAYHPGNRT